MSASITTFDLGWSTPKGQPVFSNLNLSFNEERVGIVGRNGVGKTSLLKLLSGERESSTGTIAVRGKVCMLRQIVQVAPDETIAGLFGLSGDLALLRKAEEGLATIDELAEADWTLESRIAQAFAHVGLDATPDTLLAVLSGGQRTRAAMAGVLLEEPDFLLLDEPSNNLDREGKRALIELLGAWRGGAIIVSHDRELLETMDAIVEMTTLGATRYGGNWSHYRERKAVELAAAQRDLESAGRQLDEIKRKSQVAVERKQRRDATGSRKGARGDMPRILAGARKERAENSGGENARLAERLRQEATAATIAAKQQIELIETMVVSLAPTGLLANKIVLSMHHVSAGYGGSPPIFRDFSLTVTGPERIAIVGSNGVGKTTLLDLIAGRMQPLTGALTRTASFAMLDQTAGILDPALSIAENFRALNPATDELACRSALAKFKFKADAALQSVGSLSGGQILRAGLACILGSPKPPELLILDEPTNHLDLESVEAVEAGLSAFDGALVVVSHDEAFLDAISATRRIILTRSST
ncbi:ATP-binding cassette domain-containing protein [Sphingobium sp. PNB]|uniref:ABC-F family ATP-binding cassette domain-containing protein n=1 Tax=Sphingobium sp. PNB TaxID=863934 RepID=UPI001CA44F95|nr:ABC-F family ATP-binding cassette domain-containing protein [Sphingobium sp. PNB]MCB4859652.1 ATP-binding cassette domain-containing protein [Sphingobium sp. PNB]